MAPKHKTATTANDGKFIVDITEVLFDTATLYSRIQNRYSKGSSVKNSLSNVVSARQGGSEMLELLMALEKVV
jgi:hypothetical protein